MRLDVRVRLATAAGILLALLAGPGISSLAAQTQRGGPPILLLQSVDTSGDFIRLADLLPANAPEWVVELSAEIVLGRAPQPGAIRAFTQDQLQRALSRVPQVLAVISIPPRVEVRSSARELSKEQILSAILHSLESNHVDTLQPINTDALLHVPHVATHTESPGLEVTQLEEDPANRNLRFRLWTAAEPSLHPFWVETNARMAEVSPEGDGLGRAPIRAGKATELSQVRAESGSSPASGASGTTHVESLGSHFTAPLAEPGEPVTLLIQGSGLQIQAAGVALERGWKDQQIRVRVVSTGKVLVARLIGRRMLVVQM